MRNIKVAAAQLGPIQKADSRQAVVARMLELMRQAEGCDLIVYPELALTTFFPRWHYEDRSDADIWFEREMPNAATRPLFEKAAQYDIGFYLGARTGCRARILGDAIGALKQHALLHVLPVDAVGRHACLEPPFEQRVLRTEFVTPQRVTRV